MQDIESEVKSLIAEVLEKDPSEITPEARFVEDLNMDSMMALEILAGIEKKYKIAIPEEKMMEFKNLKDTVAIVQQYLGGL